MFYLLYLIFIAQGIQQLPSHPTKQAISQPASLRDFTNMQRYSTQKTVCTNPINSVFLIFQVPDLLFKQLFNKSTQQFNAFSITECPIIYLLQSTSSKLSMLNTLQNRKCKGKKKIRRHNCTKNSETLFSFIISISWN